MNRLPLAALLSTMSISLVGCHSGSSTTRPAADYRGHKAEQAVAQKEFSNAFDAYTRAVSADDPTLLFSMLSDQVEFWSPGGVWAGPEGRQKLIDTLNEHTRAGCRIKITLLTSTYSGDTAVYEFKAEGDVMIGGQKQPYKGQNALLIRISGGKITALHGYQGQKSA